MTEGGQRKKPVATGGATMQLDAVVDDLEEVPDVGGLADLPRGTAPPPLPPKKAGAGAWIAGVAVVLLMTGAGLGIGYYVLGWGQPAQAPQAAAPRAEVEAEVAATEELAEPDQADDQAHDQAEAEPAEDVVQLDEFVIDHE